MTKKTFSIGTVLAVLSITAWANPQMAFPPEMNAEISNDLQNIRVEGFITRINQIPGPEYTLGKIKENRQHVKEKKIKKANAGYSVLEEFDPAKLSFPVADVPAEYLKSNSENFIIPQSTSITRIYSHSAFGLLKITEYVGDISYVYDTNIQIAGQAALFFHTKNQGQKWTTTISTSNGLKVFLFESNKRLNGAQKDRFIALAEAVVSD